MELLDIPNDSGLFHMQTGVDSSNGFLRHLSARVFVTKTIDINVWGVDCWTTLDFLVTCWIGTSAPVYYRRGLKRLTKLGSESSGISECFSKPDIHSPGGKDPRAETRSGSASR